MFFKSVKSQKFFRSSVKWWLEKLENKVLELLSQQTNKRAHDIKALDFKCILGTMDFKEYLISIFYRSFINRDYIDTLLKRFVKDALKVILMALLKSLESSLSLTSTKND